MLERHPLLHLVVAPFIGLAFILFMPIAGFVAAFALICTLLAKAFGLYPLLTKYI